MVGWWRVLCAGSDLTGQLVCRGPGRLVVTRVTSAGSEIGVSSLGLACRIATRLWREVAPVRGLKSGNNLVWGPRKPLYQLVMRVGKKLSIQDLTGKDGGRLGSRRVDHVVLKSWHSQACNVGWENLADRSGNLPNASLWCGRLDRDRVVTSH